jgi:hypothetical protein
VTARSHTRTKRREKLRYSIESARLAARKSTQRSKGSAEKDEGRAEAKRDPLALLTASVATAAAFAVEYRPRPRAPHTLAVVVDDAVRREQQGGRNR